MRRREGEKKPQEDYELRHVLHRVSRVNPKRNVGSVSDFPPFEDRLRILVGRRALYLSQPRRWFGNFVAVACKP